MDDKNTIDMSVDPAKIHDAFTWRPFNFKSDKPTERDDGFCAHIKIVRPDGSIERYRYSVVYQRRIDPEQPEFSCRFSIQQYVLFRRKLHDAAILNDDDVGQIIRGYLGPSEAKADAELDVQRICGAKIDRLSILPYTD